MGLGWEGSAVPPTQPGEPCGLTLLTLSADQEMVISPENFGGFCLLCGLSGSQLSWHFWCSSFCHHGSLPWDQKE